MHELLIRKRDQFIIIFLAFIIHGIGIAFNVMILVPSFTEVRPVNSIPVPGGLMFGTTAALACAFGNLAADCMGHLMPSSSLGFIGNFVAAFLPYRLWYIYRDEKPNVHSLRNLLLYVWITFVSALSVSWIIGSGLWVIFDVWTETLSEYIFLNDFIFPLIFGLPVFIVMTAPMVNVRCVPGKMSLIKMSVKKKRRCALIFMLMLSIIFMLTQTGSPGIKPLVAVLSVPCCALSVILML